MRVRFQVGSKCPLKHPGCTNSTIRTMEIAQTLREDILSAKLPLIRSWIIVTVYWRRTSPKKTYKKPSKKTPSIRVFWARFILRDQTIGIGRHKIMKSVRRLLILVAMPKATMFMHLAVVACVSSTRGCQKAFTGTHWKMVANKTAIHQATTMTAATTTAMRKRREGKKRR